MNDHEFHDTINKIKLLILDIDGVLAEGIIMGNDGQEFKQFDGQDGAGIKYWHRTGHKTAIITGRTSECVSKRAQDLGIEELHQGALVKLDVFAEMISRLNLQPDEVAYVGDDLMDLPIMMRIAFPVAVSNARPELKEIAAYITKAQGGHGAVREVIELILKTQGHWQTILNRYMPQN